MPLVLKKPLRWCRRLLSMVSLLRKVACVRVRYKRLKIKCNARLEKGESLKVLFLVSEAAKWKMQSLYDTMLESRFFSPMVAISCYGDWWNHPEYENMFEATKQFFHRQNVQYVEVASFKTMKHIDIASFKPDIVFYDQPYNWPRQYMPYEISKYALTCYIPYYLPTQEILPDHYGTELHRTLTFFFEVNDLWANEYKKRMSSFFCAPKILGLGNTFLDYYESAKLGRKGMEYIIYAPHWSFDHPRNVNRNNLSTFLVNGRTILEFAKQHQEFHWVFKPHPALRLRLIASGAWTEEEVDEYYSTWWSFAERRDGSDYLDLFADSKVMITDCASFLAEYPPLGGAVIHLISSSCKDPPSDINKVLYDSFYKVHNIDEMLKVFEDVIVKGLDPKYRQRMNAIEALHLARGGAAQRIADFIVNEFSNLRTK